MFVTLALPTVPELWPTVQVWLPGCVPMLTAYADPSATAVANVKAPLLLTVNASPPLSSKMTELPALSPDTLPPIECVIAAVALQATDTLLTLAETVPLPWLTLQVSPLGAVPTVTA